MGNSICDECVGWLCNQLTIIHPTDTNHDQWSTGKEDVTETEPIGCVQDTGTMQETVDARVDTRAL